MWIYIFGDLHDLKGYHKCLLVGFPEYIYSCHGTPGFTCSLTLCSCALECVLIICGLFLGNTHYLHAHLEMFSPMQNKRLLTSIVVKNHLWKVNASQSVFKCSSHLTAIAWCYITQLHCSLSVQNEMYLYTYLQHTYRELKLLHKKLSLSHRKQLTLSSRAMDSSCMFQKIFCQQKYQKHNWMCKLACLAIFRCLLILDS